MILIKADIHTPQIPGYYYASEASLSTPKELLTCRYDTLKVQSHAYSKSEQKEDSFFSLPFLLVKDMPSASCIGAGVNLSSVTWTVKIPTFFRRNFTLYLYREMVWS